MSSKKQARVGPSEINSDIVEIRPSRKLRIQHFNERPRDEKFEREMQIYSLYRQKNVISSGPLTMPKHQKHSQKNISQDKVGDQLQIALSQDGLDHSNKNYGHVKTSAVLDANICKLKLQGNEMPTDFSPGNVNKQELHSDLMAQELKPHHNIPDTCALRHEDIIPQGSSFDENIQTSDSITADYKDLVIFFIHGVGGSSDLWCSQTQYLSRLGYEIICPDLIGHGLSCAPKNAKAYHFNEIAVDLETIFNKYCKRRNIIIGHSYGASFASYLARHRPKRVMKLILISGGPPTPLAPQPGVFQLPYFMLACIKPCVVLGFHKGAFHKAKAPVISKKEAFNIPTYVLQNIMNGQDWPDGDELFHGWLTCPCLLIYGADDQLVSLSDEQDMAKVIFDSQLEVIRNASHMVMVEAPDEVNQIIEAFIKKPLYSVASQAQNSSVHQGTSQLISQSASE
ncbi:protein ABHD8-like [Biomphalaria glabrata]|uniref:acylglycerol lipase n=1 Tax=Biomphalaria glabrata TaxID=6526 RepID=A0A9U8DXS3_BIOGL|nr:protein ABHD8-like [Biomphalaria glabrata]